MRIHINDTERDVPAGATLADLASDLGFAERKGVAVAVNDAVVSRSIWSDRVLAEGDRVLVIQATQGG